MAVMELQNDIKGARAIELSIANYKLPQEMKKLWKKVSAPSNSRSPIWKNGVVLQNNTADCHR